MEIRPIHGYYLHRAVGSPTHYVERDDARVGPPDLQPLAMRAHKVNRVVCEEDARGEGVEVILHKADPVAPLPEVAPALPDPVKCLGGFVASSAERSRS